MRPKRTKTRATTFSIILLLINCLSQVSANTTQDTSTVWVPDCFEETDKYGRADIVDNTETLYSDRNRLDNIDKTVYGD